LIHPTLAYRLNRILFYFNTIGRRLRQNTRKSSAHSHSMIM